MNPWEIVSWVGAATVALILIAVMTATIKTIITPRPKQNSTRIFNSRKSTGRSGT